jgi:cob(I)alamin adenosyltransferase
MTTHTGSGDYEETELMGGRKISKDDLRVEAYGTIDEANSFLGLVACFSEDKQINDIIEKIQQDLFAIGSNLATPEEDRTRINYPIPEITPAHVNSLEKIIEEIEKELPSLKKFILPAGCRTASALHVARSVIRRAERIVVSYSKKEKINPEIIKYLNRLSSLLFELARLANKRENVSEKEWSVKD